MGNVRESNVERSTSGNCWAAGSTFRGTWHYDGMPRVNGDLSLFEGQAKIPDGFFYRENFISEAEEQELIREIQKLHLTPFKYYQFTGKRRTASFGWQYEFGASEITTAPDMPAFLLPVRTRAGTLFNIAPNSLIQTSIIEYSTGVSDWLASRYSAFWRRGWRFSWRSMPDEVSKI